MKAGQRATGQIPLRLLQGTLVGLFMVGFAAASAAPSTASAPAVGLLPHDSLFFFENKIRPVLAEHCYKCHSAMAPKAKGGLLLDSRDGLLKGGESGPGIVAGEPEKSLLIQAVRYTNPDLQMPPKGERLGEAQINDLVAWVKMGAPDPRVEKPDAQKSKAVGAQHWSFQPVSVATPLIIPSPADRPVNAVDAFIGSRLAAEGMKPAGPADRRTLLRRVYFDLIGLPPTPQEVEDFVNDRASNAYEKVIDRLLARPQYGERWARHWLDVARYADSKGEVKRQRETPLYPFAWTYRDYVIKAFNDDKPYDRFIIEQIAADQLPVGRDNPVLAALGFLTLGERFQNNENDIINDRIDVVSKGLLGLTVTCARCHDHMFDPIPTRDYYSLRGIFASSYEPRVEPVIGLANEIASQPDYPAYYKQRTTLQKELEELLPKARQGSPAERRELLKRRMELQNQIDVLELTHPGAPPRAQVLYDRPEPKDSPIFLRGEAENPGGMVPRRFLECLSGPTRKPFTRGSGRLELANAIASRDNPLTARVMVNRVWQHHFGEGLVASPDDFGAMGSPPSHPELLDYLARFFMDHGWSVKQLHKLILLSATYQQSSANNPRYAEIDPMNRLLWRQNIRRLEFEPLRDSLLALGGTLETNLYGRPVPLALARGRNFRAALVLEPSHRPQDIGYTTRRTIYGFVDRSDLPEVFNHFDFANPDMECGRRHETIVPQQALYLMNSPLVIEQARHLAERPDVQAGRTDAEKIQRLYEVIYQRRPRPEEIQLGLEFLENAARAKDAAPSPSTVAPFLGRGAGGKAGIKEGVQQVQARRAAHWAARRLMTRPVKPLTAWAEYSHALLLANETAFVN